MLEVFDFDDTPNAVGLGWRGLSLFGLVCMVYSSHGRPEAANGSLGFFTDLLLNRPTRRGAAAKAVIHVGRSGEFDGTDRDLAVARIASRIVLHLLTFTQAADAGAFQRGDMDKDILLAVVRLNEAEAFLIVVEFHYTRIHRSSFL